MTDTQQRLHKALAERLIAFGTGYAEYDVPKHMEDCRKAAALILTTLEAQHAVPDDLVTPDEGVVHAIATIIARNLGVKLNRRRTENSGWITYGNESCGIVDAAREALATLPKADPAGAVDVERATNYARGLATALAEKHYPDVPQQKPLPDLLGSLTQIDNMTTGLTRAALSSPSAGLISGEIWSHPDGGTYHIVERGRMKHPDTGAWIDAIAYRDTDPDRGDALYMTTVSRWKERFSLANHRAVVSGEGEG